MSELELASVEAYLPDVVKQMIEVVGFPATENVIKSFGGVDFSFSLGKQYFPRLVDVIGLDSATKLRQHFNRERLYIPRCDAALRILRNAKFRAEFEKIKKEKGISGNLAMLELCPKYGISERFAWKVLQEPSSLEQESLF
ncbi:Mor transcription activator family protein [Otariodibacter oris]|uniref:Mor transcription activator family protein n=1 Tax=Otariodibacter oris TaxID=1032623 RepID=A0A420XIR4_9PAST|nr:Mor transcription activator family protein [Otariodibacter oris]QGM80678.1 hypothetical protein A6A10_04300 [Otariodibacter oris]RKR77159.1 Mor transcription activator family protein [Otariodibacter oris]